MSIEPIGLFAVFVGILCLCFGPRFSSFAFLVSTLFGAAAAAILTSFGSASVPPAQLLLGFLALDLLFRPRLFQTAATSMMRFGPGFWLALTICYGVPASIIMPRLFQGAAYVFALGRSQAGVSTILLTPLAPVSANVTQSLYFIGDFVAFLTIYAYASSVDGPRVLAKAVIVTAFFDIGFAIIDLVTYFTNTADLLTFMRNSSYRMLTDVETAGFKRIVGSFSEASSFAYATLACLAFCLSLWLRMVYTKAAGLAALGCCTAILFATSSTGYLGLAILMLTLYTVSIVDLMRARASRNAVLFLIIGPLIVAIMSITIYLMPAARESAARLLNAALLTKATSASGVERSAWNKQALDVFVQTSGLGAGIGSVRASSWLFVVPASIGALGTLFYWGFLISVLVRSNRWGDPRDAAIQFAAKISCFAMFAASSVAGDSVDLGLQFFIFAAIASGRRLRRQTALTEQHVPDRPPAGSVFAPVTSLLPAPSAVISTRSQVVFNYFVRQRPII